MNVPEDWVPVWRGLAAAFLRDGYCSPRGIEQWAKENKFHLRLVREVLEVCTLRASSMRVLIYLRLSGKVVPFLPREVRDVRTYRQAGNAA